MALLARKASVACPARRVTPAVNAISPIRPSSRVMPARRVVVKASSGNSGDFDTFLMDMANKFEKADNKPAIIGYSAAAVGALFFSEWLIHLPVFNVLLGFPIQLLGLVVSPYLAIKYLVDNGNISEDVTSVSNTIISKLPGLKKE